MGFLTGRYFAVRKQNETEFAASVIRDRGQVHALLRDQMQERGDLQVKIGGLRERHAKQVLALYRDAAQFRQMRAGQSHDRSAGFDLER